MNRPWITAQDVRTYTSSDKVKARSDAQLAYDIARAERYVIYYTHNNFEDCVSLPDDVQKATVMLAEAYAKQEINLKDGAMESETFDDYAYTIKSDSDIVDGLNIRILLDDYVIKPGSGTINMRLRKL